MGPLAMGNSHAPYGDEHLTIDFARQTATLDAELLVLTRKEYELLALLVQHAGTAVPRDVLLARVWGYSPDIRTRTLDAHIWRLRRRLGSTAGWRIETVLGVGYRFQPPEPAGAGPSPGDSGGPAPIELKAFPVAAGPALGQAHPIGRAGQDRVRPESWRHAY